MFSTQNFPENVNGETQEKNEFAASKLIGLLSKVADTDLNVDIAKDALSPRPGKDVKTALDKGKPNEDISHLSSNDPRQHDL